MKIKAHHILIVAALVALFIFVADDAAAQCSMCRKIATDGSDKRAVGNNINSAILYLMALPYVLVALFFRKQIVQFVGTLRGKR